MAKLPQSVWLVERTGTLKTGEYQSFVCFAISERQARFTDPQTGLILGAEEHPPYWSGDARTYRATRLGRAMPHLRKIMGRTILCAQFFCCEKVPAYQGRYKAQPLGCACNESCDFTCDCNCHQM